MAEIGFAPFPLRFIPPRSSDPNRDCFAALAMTKEGARNDNEVRTGAACGPLGRTEDGGQAPFGNGAGPLARRIPRPGV